MRYAEVRIIEPQSEEIHNSVELTDAEIEEFRYKMYPDEYRKKEINKRNSNPPQELKRFNANDDYNPNGDYYDVKYSSIELDGEEYQQELNFKIEIKSDMPL